MWLIAPLQTSGSSSGRLPIEPNFVQFLIAMMDKTLQLKLFSTSGEGDSHVAQAGALVQDIKALFPLWQKACENMNDNKFGDLLNAVGVVLQCSASVGSDTPSPSHVRAARHLVHQLASNESFGYQSAKAMAMYDGPKRAMESARLVAELGLKDAAADAAFERLLKKIETPLELAFVCISDWVSTANGGKAHDVGSYRVLLQLAQTSIVEMHMVITSWSLARLEQQLEASAICH